jgi:hypothetical protein
LNPHFSGEFSVKFIFPAISLLILATGCAGAQQIDASCSQPGSGPLKVLKSCAKLYCKPSVKLETTRDNIKFVDDTLAAYDRRNETFAEAVSEYQTACRALMRKFCQACPLMDAVNSTVLRVQIRGEEVEESAGILRGQENFSRFGAVVSRDEGDLACSSQIIALSAKAMELHNATTLRFANTRCDQ